MEVSKRVIRFFLYLSIIAVTIAVGLWSRSDAVSSETLLGKYGGDVLWAAMVYWGAALLFFNRTYRAPFLFAMLFSFGIEFSQFSHAHWLMDLRATRLGALVLGHGFLFSDLICYSVGITVALFADYHFVRRFTGSAVKTELIEKVA